MKDKDFKLLKEAYNLVENVEFDAFKDYAKSRNNVFNVFFDKNGNPETEKVKSTIQFEKFPVWWKHQFKKGEYGEDYLNDIQRYLEDRYIPFVLSKFNTKEHWDYQDYDKNTVDQVLIEHFVQCFYRWISHHIKSKND